MLLHAGGFNIEKIFLQEKEEKYMCVFLVGFVVRKQNKGEEERKISREWSLSAELWGGVVAQGHPSSTVPFQPSTASRALKSPPSHRGPLLHLLARPQQEEKSSGY